MLGGSGGRAEPQGRPSRKGLGRILAVLLEAEVTSTSFEDVVHVRSHGVMGKEAEAEIWGGLESGAAKAALPVLGGSGGCAEPQGRPSRKGPEEGDGGMSGRERCPS